MDIKNTSNVLVLNDSTPEEVARAMIEGNRQKEPFHLFDMDEVYRRVERFRQMMPRVDIFYAMKANDSDKMLKLAAALGLGFGCASPGEIHKILSLGVSPRSIIFAVPKKARDWLAYARTSGERYTTFDSSLELKKIKQFWPEARLLIRVKVESDNLYQLGGKAVCDFGTSAVELLEEAAALGIKVAGVALHVDSGCSAPLSHVAGLRYARALFDHEARAGRHLSIVDIGEGFFNDKIYRIDHVSELINKGLEEYFQDLSVQITGEPGRYLCEATTTLFCSINGIRRVERDGEIFNMLYLNDGLYGTLRNNEAWHTVKKFQRNTDIINEEFEKTILWGPSCDCVDRVMQNVDVMLPRCGPADWLVFANQGAYTFGFASQFSSLPMPLIRSVISRKLWNKIKNNKVFAPEDFEENVDVSAPLPSTMPPLVKNTTTINSNILKI